MNSLVWSIDITYIPMKKGFMYLTAIIDVYSRFIVAWSLHNTLDASNCIEVLKTAISRYGAPEIINSDQGCQFTSKEWAETCAEHPEMKVSMDGRGRAKDNIWIERFWKTIKYEYIYIQPEENGADLFTESGDSSMTITITVVSKESTVQYQANSTFVRLLGLNKEHTGNC